jgi:hypothetical protein
MRSGRAVENTATPLHVTHTGSDAAEDAIQRLVAPEFRLAARMGGTSTDYAANLNFGCNPARAASLISKSRLKRLILPRLMSDTRAALACDLNWPANAQARVTAQRGFPAQPLGQPEINRGTRSGPLASCAAGRVHCARAFLPSSLALCSLGIDSNRLAANSRSWRLVLRVFF